VDFVACISMYKLDHKYFIVSSAIFLIVLFLIVMFDEKVKVDRIAFNFMLTSLVGVALGSVSDIYRLEGDVFILLYILLACFVCDTMAYFCGMAFGKHKLLPRISPNKTWEGSIGGYVCGALVSIIYGLIVLNQLPISLIVCGGLLLPIISQIGDLAFSSIKRRFKIKDFSNIFPGHGGVLDRVDSLIFSLMLFEILMLIWGIV